VSFVLGEKTAAELGLSLVAQGTTILQIPATRDRTLAIPGRHGELDFGADLASRLFTLRCVLKPRPTKDFVQTLRELAAHLLDIEGRPRTLELIIEPESDRHYYVRYAGSLPVELYANWGQLALPLVAHDPFAYGAPREDVREVTASPSLWDLASEGTADAPLWIKIENLADPLAAGFQLACAGRVMGYIADLASGAVLILNSATLQATLNGTNALHAVVGDFLRLQPGTNALTYSDSAATRQLRVTVSWRDRWL
jgi:phage-related protein